jgi:hypothetical protein
MVRYIKLSSVRYHDDLHIHLLVPRTANHGTNHLVFAGLGGCRHQKFLNPRLQQEIPAWDNGSIFRVKKREAMDRTISISILRFDGRDAEADFLARSQCNDGLLLTRNFEAAVTVREDFDQPGLWLHLRRRRIRRLRLTCPLCVRSKQKKAKRG